MAEISGRVVMQCDEHDQENCPVCNEERYAMYCTSGDDGHIECEKPRLQARIRGLEQALKKLEHVLGHIKITASDALHATDKAAQK